MGLSKTAALKALSQLIRDEIGDPHLNVKEYSDSPGNGKSQFFIGYHYSSLDQTRSRSDLKEVILSHEVDISSPDMLGSFKKKYCKDGVYALKPISDVVGVLLEVVALYKEKSGGSAMNITTDYSRWHHAKSVAPLRFQVGCCGHDFYFEWDRGSKFTSYNKAIGLKDIRKNCLKVVESGLKSADGLTKEVDDLLVRVRSMSDEKWKKVLRRRPSLRDMIYRETR